MYKTVRKGDASLQYTILPQTDQFNAPGFQPQSTKARPKIIKYTMIALMVLIALSCVATPFLINQNDHNLFASTVLAIGRAEHDVFENATAAFAKEMQSASLRHEMSAEAHGMAAGREMAGLKNPEDLSTTSPSSLGATFDPSTTTTLEASTTTSTTLKSFITTTDAVKVPSNIPRKLPRVTLKLRENETIPQMYMKAGIASYKKGNITTSVLAHGLSLEGLIFKTPEGTIKPWPQKWPFVDPSSYFQWKGMSKMPLTIYFVLAGLAVLATVSIVLMFHVQRKASRRQRKSVEAPEVGDRDEDKSTLLGGEAREAETEEKE